MPLAHPLFYFTASPDAKYVLAIIMNIYKTLGLSIIYLLTMAACSSDEADDGSTQQTLKPSDMIVSLEELVCDEELDSDATRSYMSRDMKSHLWLENDSMRVYDSNLVRFDIYKFGWKDDQHQSGVFSRVLEQSFYTEDAAWALFAYQDIDGGYFDRDHTTFQPYIMSKFRIGVDAKGNQQVLTSEAVNNGGNTYFTDWLPRWGQVTKINDGQVLHTSMKFLTAVLRLQLAGTSGKADLLKVQMLEEGTKPINIAGIFSARLAVNGEMQPDASLTADSYEKRSGGTEILADLTGAAGSLVVYIPLVTTTVPVDIVVSASNDQGQTWTEFKRFKNKTVTRGKVYGNSQEFVF